MTFDETVRRPRRGAPERSSAGRPGGRGVWAALVVVPVVAVLAACSTLTAAVADAWSVTYEVTVTGADGGRLADVSYDEAEGRGKASLPVAVGAVETTVSPDQDGGRVWETTAVVTATERASVSATPGPGATATCAIRLDGTREIAAVTGAPGERVTCMATTPRFGE